jgi:HSP20 family protein
LSSEQDFLRKFLSLQERVHSLLERTSPSLQLVSEAGFNSNWSPPVDIYETDHEFVLLAEIPGVEQEKIDLQITDRVLSLKGERHPSREVPNQSLHRLERPFGRFERRFELPEDVTASGIKARIADGVLTVTLPKGTSRRRPIKVVVNSKK